MGFSYSRPIRRQLAAGANTIVIPLNRHASRTHVQVVLTGANTFSIDSTQDTVLWDQSVIDNAVNLQPRDALADPASAVWAEEQASGSATSLLKLNSPVAAIRIVKTTGAGTAEIRVQQA